MKEMRTNVFSINFLVQYIVSVNCFNKDEVYALISGYFLIYLSFLLFTNNFFLG